MRAKKGEIEREGGTEGERKTEKEREMGEGGREE